jgi:hypothetical protein
LAEGPNIVCLNGGHPGGSELIALSLPEIRHLLVFLIWATPPAPQIVLERSRWRRKHQHRAKQHHYKAHGHAL